MSNGKRFTINAVTTYQDNEGKERSSYARCGTAFVNQTRDGAEVINFKFDFMPVGPNVEIVGFEPKAKDDNAGGDAN